MKPIQTTALLGAVLLTACSARPSATAPSDDAVTLTPTALIGDRPYTWDFSCKAPDATIGGINASWSWTQNGVEVTGYGGSAWCSPSGISSVSGSGTRPATANGFSACVGYTCQSWSFDPSGPFSTSLKGMVGVCVSDLCGCPGICRPKPKYVTITGLLKVDS